MRKVFGFVLAIFAFPLLFLNEGRAVRTARSLEEGAAVVIQVKNAPVKTANDGKLVHFNGPAAAASTLRDPVFEVEAKALQLSRKVETYQWKEVSLNSNRSNRNSGSVPSDYDYQKIWSEEVFPSSQFRFPQGHQNPAFIRYPATTFAAADVTVGDFRIPQRVIAGLHGDHLPLVLDENATNLPPAVGLPGGQSKLDQGGFYVGRNPADPQVGDMRMRFTTLRLGDLSVIGRQRGATVEPYPTKAGNPVEMGLVGLLDAREMFDGAIQTNTVITWAARIGGFVLMFFGAFLVFRVGGLLRWIPILGGVVNAGTGLLAFGLASVASLATIALAWFVYRPALSLALLAAGGAVGLFVWRESRQKKGGFVP